MEAEVLLPIRNTLGEGPLWHPEEGRLYWTDIDEKRIHAWRPGEEPETIHIGSRIGGFTIQENGDLLLFVDDGALFVLDTHRELRLARPALESERGFRWNDVAADPEGRVFGGTLGPGSGRFYRLDLDGSLHLLEEGIGCSNGIAWSPDLRTMYYIDSSVQTVWQYDYDRATGALYDRRTFYKLEGEGAPDGMTVDASGELWVAVWGQSCVLRLTPRGELIERVATGSKNTTCPSFGGPEYRDLYITSAADETSPNPGALFVVRNAAQGRPDFRSRITI